MPGFVLEEAFPLARFNKKIGENDGRLFKVGVNALESILDVTRDSDRSDIADYVAVTVQGEGFKIYNTMDQKCTQSWIAPPGVAFAGPATYQDGGQDPDSTDYTYAIIASSPELPKQEQLKTVWLWKNTKNNDNDSADHITKTFEERIHAIHISSALHSHVILISENGSIELNTKDLERLIAKQKAHKNTSVVWSTVFVTSNAHCCIPSSVVPARSTIVVTINQSANHYTVKLDYVNVERRSIDNLASMDIKLTEKPIAFTLDPNDGRLTVLDAAGTWSIWRLQLKYSSTKKMACHLLDHVSIPLKGYRFQDKVLGNIAAITPLGDSYVAMVAPRIKSKQEEEHVVSVWDVKYGTLQAEQVVKTTEKNTFSKNCVYSIAALPNSHLAITISSTTQYANSTGKTSKKMVDTSSVVMLCPYYSEPVSLMAAMGKMKQTVAFMGISDDVSASENIGFSRSGNETVMRDLHFSADLQDSEDIYDKWVAKINKTHKSESKALAELLKNGVSEEKFTETFFEYVNVKRATQESDDTLMTEASFEAKTEQYRQWMTSKFVPTKKKVVELSQFFVSSILSRCCPAEQSDDFWPVDVLLYLMSRSLVRSSYCEKGIVRTLLDKDDWALMPIVLEKVLDIPESDLVTLVKALIAKQTEHEEWAGTRFNKYFKMVVEAPRNDIFLQQALKRIDAVELPIILTTFAGWLKEKSSNLNNRSNIVDFCNSILDVHFPTLILEPPLQPVVHTLRELISQEIEVIDDLEQLRNILGAYNRKHKHARAKKSLERQANKNNADAPQDELTRFRKKKNGKFGGEQGIPIYRVEVFKF
ncbi:hypothetical protein G6F57_008100 [Rhizopus arrhizus]|uniref:Utp8 C-terminal domain-containing protein n=1 Tax=Rhizopus oryzae TaxID=64495 RepID=A0A9P6X699_RHIOR|nr:hypothetical protein G6F24_008003 [Rhizopus arrhizus]KAG1413062.1 hypothetical protein G6F58_007690 [Rhizopus delemar]KAG0783875.1 hypothetical protein G6F21_010263 [Rhizopus arrhizus]KAG0799095.1 hypothetical protein G6F22_003569 [Rhizopus arrhizus]KAG0809569.1 hypothetical protein G6F20_008673 [Rhizopus arrhizus]